MPASLPSIFKEWSISPDEFSEIVRANPSLRGMTFGYVSEFKLKKFLLAQKGIVSVSKCDDHNRRQKGDLIVNYKGKEFSIEAKSLQSNTVKEENGKYRGKFQCDASDRREIELPNGERIETTCLKVGEFDILAVNLFEFGKNWRFAFALNKDLPRSTYPKYTPQQQKYLLATLMDAQWPIKAPFVENPTALFENLGKRK